MVDFPTENGPMVNWVKVEAVQGSESLLKELSNSATCSIATNSKDSTEADIRKALARVNLDRYITNIFCYANIGFEKPSKAFFHRIYMSLNVNKDDIVLIGDNLETDVRGALDFGFHAIWFNTTNEPAPEGIRSIDNLAQIINL